MHSLARFTLSALALALGFTAGLQAQEGATVLFSQSGSQIINAAGNSRPASRGERLQTGERLVTPANAISQIKLPDGSLVGVRPGSELSIDSSSRQQTIAVQQGGVRVIGAELIKPQASSNLVVQTPQARVELRAGDLETAVTRPPAGNRQDGEAGSYNRLQAGAASLQKPGAPSQGLDLRQTTFVDNSGKLAQLGATLPPPTAGEAPRPPRPAEAPPPGGSGKTPPGQPPLVPQLGGSSGAPPTLPVIGQGGAPVPGGMPPPPAGGLRPPLLPPPGQAGAPGAGALGKLPPLPPQPGMLPGTPQGRPPGVVPGPFQPGAPKPPQPPSQNPPPIQNPPPGGMQPPAGPQAPAPLPPPVRP
ncbi:FecR family protein [Dechloromonas sp. ZY10]|uniref:FecR family protein n=1 Tax=Dechloromonas aquae TaxID=2664436 RepID=UPI003527B89F